MNCFIIKFSSRIDWLFTQQGDKESKLVLVLFDYPLKVYWSIFVYSDSIPREKKYCLFIYANICMSQSLMKYAASMFMVQWQLFGSRCFGLKWHHHRTKTTTTTTTITKEHTVCTAHRPHSFSTYGHVKKREPCIHNSYGRYDNKAKNTKATQTNTKI